MVSQLGKLNQIKIISCKTNFKDNIRQQLKTVITLNDLSADVIFPCTLWFHFHPEIFERYWYCQLISKVGLHVFYRSYLHAFGSSISLNARDLLIFRFFDIFESIQHLPC